MNEEALKNSFSKVKEDIQALSEEIKTLKSIISQQNELISKISTKLISFQEELKSLKKESSTGNEGVNQSINHLINQSINHLNTNQSQNSPIWAENAKNNEIKPQKSPENSSFFNEKQPNQSINQSITNQSFNHLINQQPPKTQLKQLTNDLSKVFLSLSKQELKTFLSIYQMEEEGLETTYKALSIKMGLSEHCIRSHISSIIKKNAPIVKKRLNNRLNLVFIHPDFKTLNLKQKLINLYYDSDPNQKTLFNSV